MTEHRRVMRVSMLQPLPAVAGNEQVAIVDASLRGLRISHLTLFSARSELSVRFVWDGERMELTGSLRWTKLQRLGIANFERNVYHSGVEIRSIDAGSEATLRRLVETHVERALDDRRANARGVPPPDRPAKTDTVESYVRHELVSGVWRKIVTTDSGQPLSGFTVASSEPRDQVQILRTAYEVADPQMRRVIQKVADLTITNSDGAPVRRYTP